MKGIHDFEPGDIKIVLSRHRLDLDATSMRQIYDCLPACRPDVDVSYSAFGTASANFLS